MENLQRSLTEQFSKNQEEEARKNQEAIEDANMRMEGRLNRFREDQNGKISLLMSGQEKFFEEMRGMMNRVRDLGKNPMGEGDDQFSDAGRIRNGRTGAGIGRFRLEDEGDNVLSCSSEDGPLTSRSLTSSCWNWSIVYHCMFPLIVSVCIG
uniref:Uncharacterized protein n=1 Tax=Chenopodium quinoa TaxID=63459 RepID=A0A803MI11_CHEQI